MKDEIGKIKYYYHRDSNRHPLVTTCLVSINCKDGTVDVGKGIVFCSLSENPIKKEGRAKALERAMDALNNQETTEPVRRGAAAVVCMASTFALPRKEMFKSQFNPTLTTLDKKLLKISDV